VARQVPAVASPYALDVGVTTGQGSAAASGRLRAMSTHLAFAEVLASWALGWEALVAIGTLLLAVATFLLVLRTAALARSSDADIRAQWRPIILPAAYDAGDSALFYTDGVLYVGIKNAGRGPALYIRAQIEPDGVSPEIWPLGALAAGDKYELEFRIAKPDSAIQVLFDYRDLAGRTYSTSITIEVIGGELRFYDVRLFEDHAVTTLGDAIYPQPGLRDVSPKVRPGLRARLRMMGRSLRGDFEEHE
jgi:hypothetical protein